MLRFGSLSAATALGVGKLSFAIFLILCAVGLASAHAQQINIITFDAPGADTNPGDFNGTYSSSINFWGAITGSYQDANGTFHGFVRSPNGTVATFDAPGADTTPGDFNGTSPTSINDAGEITGYYSDAKGFNHGFVRTPAGKFKKFEAPGAGGFGSFPIGINLEGAVVGYYTNSNVLFHSFIRHPDGTFSTFLAPGQCDTNVSQGCYGSELTNINFFGFVIGNFMDSNFVGHGLIRHPDGSFTIFDVPNAGTGQYQGTLCPGCTAGLNQWGAVAGTYIDGNSVQHGFLRSPDGTITSFDAPGAGTGGNEGTGCPSDCPTSLNDFGVIAGDYIDTNFVFHGYLRSPDGTIVTVDPAGSQFTWFSSLNDFSAMTGYYLDANNVYHGFVAIPCREECSDNDKAATRVNSATITNLNPGLNRMLNPTQRSLPWYRNVGGQVLK